MSCIDPNSGRAVVCKAATTNLSMVVYFIAAVALTVIGALGLSGIVGNHVLAAAAIGLGGGGFVLSSLFSLLHSHGEPKRPVRALYYAALAIIPLACAILGALCLTSIVNATTLGYLSVTPIGGFILYAAVDNWCGTPRATHPRQN